jgi:predicted ATPase
MINQIKIEGYKSIKKLDLELKPINILIGANGVGKSNFISFFKLVNMIYEQKLQFYVKKQGGADNLLHFGRKKTEEIKGGISFKNLNSIPSKSYIFKLTSNVFNNLFFSKESISFGKIDFENNHPLLSNIKHKQTEESLIFLIENFNMEEDILNISNNVDDIGIFHFHDTGENSPLRSTCQVDDNKSLRENGSNLAAYLYYLQQKHPKNFYKIEKTIQSIAPYFERFELQPDRLNENYIKLEWEETEQPDGYFNASHLSDGTLRFMALVTLLMQPNLPKTIIIDEPELGLHPYAINKLAGLIQVASAKTQIIIATQSINFIDNFEPEDIIAVDRKGTESTFNRLNSNDLKDWLENYSIGDLWNKNVIGARP